MNKRLPLLPAIVWAGNEWNGPIPVYLLMDFIPLLPKEENRPPGTCIAFLGGGGKTSLIQRLGTELAEQGTVLLTALTKSGPHPELNPIFLKEPEVLDSLSQWKTNPVFLMGSRITEEKYQGIEAKDLDRVRYLADITLVENDGSRNLPLKIHTDYDPPVPSFVKTVVIVVGADTVGRRLVDIVHRPERFCEHWDYGLTEPLSPEFIAQVVTSRRGYLSKVGTVEDIRYFVNKADVNRAASQRLAHCIREQSDAPVFWGSVREEWWRPV